MATSSSTNPMSITGVTINSDTKLTDDFVLIQLVVWYGVTTAGHLAMVKDKSGNVLFPFSADAPGSAGKMMYAYHFPTVPHPCNGIHVDDLDSGNLYFYYTDKIAE